MKAFASLALLAALGSAALAQTNYIVSGELTATDPVFNRPTTATTLSAVGTAVHYDIIPFQVSVTGTYAADYLSTATTAPFDPFLLVYSSFNPAAPLANLVNGDDDFTGALPITGGTGAAGGLTASRIVTGDTSNLKTGGLALTANTTYFAVATAFANTGLGTYTLGVGGGPGNVTAPGAVPEPATMAILGVGAAALLRRKRKSA